MALPASLPPVNLHKSSPRGTNTSNQQQQAFVEKNNAKKAAWKFLSDFENTTSLNEEYERMQREQQL
jgi:hypothetical protein